MTEELDVLRITSERLDASVAAKLEEVSK